MVLWLYDAVAALVPTDAYRHVADSLACVDGPPHGGAPLQRNLATSPHVQQRNWTLCHTRRDSSRFPPLADAGDTWSEKWGRRVHPLLFEAHALNRTRARTTATCTEQCAVARMCDGVNRPVLAAEPCPPATVPAVPKL